MDLFLQGQKCVDAKGAKQDGQNRADPPLSAFVFQEKIKSKKDEQEQPENKCQRRSHTTGTVKGETAI
jgi:hypothetical protein